MATKKRIQVAFRLEAPLVERIDNYADWVKRKHNLDISRTQAATALLERGADAVESLMKEDKK